MLFNMFSLSAGLMSVRRDVRHTPLTRNPRRMPLLLVVGVLVHALVKNE